MPLNPIRYTESVVNGFLKYQMTAYALADSDLNAQMRKLLSLEETRRSPLLKGPYISLSRSFSTGSSVQDLISEGVFHGHMTRLIPYPSVYAHQDQAIRAISGKKTTLVSTGTGSGKTETFLYPVISHCLNLRDENAPAGISAIIIYPMNALAEDQLVRLRGLLAGTGVTFGLYVGSTPERDADVADERLPAGSSNADYMARSRSLPPGKAIRPAEERCSRAAMREPGQQPRILLTNVKQLELLLTRQSDIELFDGIRLDYLVFDEAHTYRGAAGAETACLIRRLRTFCGKTPDQTVCVATSATIADPKGDPEAGRQFASRFFGVEATDVELVLESYQKEEWAVNRTMPPPFAGNASELLQDVLAAVETEDGDIGLINKVCRELLGYELNVENWQDDLYSRLLSNDLVHRLAACLTHPQALSEIIGDIAYWLKRQISEEELLVWLTLGAAAIREGRPLLRPVVHGFVRGIGGAVVTFPSDSELPRLFLTAEQAADDESELAMHSLPLLTCTTCGQHYFEHYVQDFDFQDRAPGGGMSSEGQRYWEPLSKQTGGKRLLLTNKLVGEDDDDEPARSSELFYCRRCGTLHSAKRNTCGGCGREDTLLRLFAVRQSEANPGKLISCVACGAIGGKTPGGYREPARPVRATSVADVDVLAREMIRHADRKRLLVFADNRQDAAFQAGWMQDHARRFRLRSLMWERVKQGPVLIGDLVASLAQVLDHDDALSESLIPEVWDVARKGDAPQQHTAERKYYLRLQVLREFTTSPRQRYGLEVWGKTRIEYASLNESDEFIINTSARLGITPSALIDGISTILDQARRKQILWDPQGQIFSKFWLEGDREIQRGYLPTMKGVPSAIKLTRGETDDKGRIKQWLSSAGTTPVATTVKQWGVISEDVPHFVTDLWRYLVAKNLLTPVTLKGSRGRALPNCNGAYQIHADQIVIVPQNAIWQCDSCRRKFAHSTPFDHCPAFRCHGFLKQQAENPDDYDLSLLDDDGEMLRAREHSAQVPHSEREYLERMFKSDSHYVNTLVCTPTLEMGVDIGGLDSVLMRNVPPLPSNYWQRAGRAGRRHRLAVNMTYARPVTHDQYFYHDPLRMLEGIVEPPRFNLRNELMVRKHVHATVITRLYQLARDIEGIGEFERNEIMEGLRHSFPSTIRDYLFDSSGELLPIPRDVTILNTIVTKHISRILPHVTTVFNDGWPAEDREAVSPEKLEDAVFGTCDTLASVISALKKRLDWAIGQISRLNRKRIISGTLDREDDAQFGRCDRMIKRFKGTGFRSRREAEGHDDTITYSVLAVEGFLPGYGLESGAITGTAIMPKYQARVGDFDLPRPPAMALREYVPGNMIYANANKFVARYFHLNNQSEDGKPIQFLIDFNAEAIQEVSGGSRETTGLQAGIVNAVPVSDVELTHFSHISDDEDYRFQLPVAVYGREMGRHAGGQAFKWGQRDVQVRRNVHIRLVNVGPTSSVKTGNCGYPLCLVCGQSVSPFASPAQLDHFKADHLERCSRAVSPVGFYTEVIADALSLLDCTDRTEAYSVLETLRVSASLVLDMEREDLQILVIAEPGSTKVTAMLYDPMPGGSGLISQLCSQFAEIAQQAMNVAGNCPSNCEDVCIDCLATFRNVYYHRHLNRKVAASVIEEWGDELTPTNEIPPLMPTSAPSGDGMPANVAEAQLYELIRRASFPLPELQRQINLGHPLGTTTPDAYYDEDGDKICIYLDGLSRHIHGNTATKSKDLAIRQALRAQDYEVIEITAHDLNDPDKMSKHFYKIARILLNRDEARRIRDDISWFQDGEHQNIN